MCAKVGRREHCTCTETLARMCSGKEAISVVAARSIARQAVLRSPPAPGSRRYTTTQGAEPSSSPVAPAASPAPVSVFIEADELLSDSVDRNRLYNMSTNGNLIRGFYCNMKVGVAYHGHYY